MAPVSAKRKRTVFLVDDHALVREWLANLISQQPDLAVCGEADSTPEAIRKIAGLRPDVVVADISLKDSSGIELIKQLKQRCPEVAVLVLSMHESRIHVERALQAGARGYVTKRESATKVVEAIRRILEVGFYISEDTAQMLAANLAAGKPTSAQPSVESFSDREREVFELLAEGKNAAQIAEMLRIDAKTVHTYFARMREKLQLGSTAELLREAFRWQQLHHPS